MAQAKVKNSSRVEEKENCVKLKRYNDSLILIIIKNSE